MGKCKQLWNIKLTLRIWCQPLSQYPLPPARRQPHSLIPSAQTPNQGKAKNPEIRFNSQQIVSKRLQLCTQNPGLREVDLEPTPKQCSDKINMLKQGRKTTKENKFYRTIWTHILIPALREVDLESSAKERVNRTKTLVTLYWLPRSLHPKVPPNRISHRLT